MPAERASELEQQIKQMSPEELRDFQKKQCIFCHIIEGKVQSRKIYNDEVCTALLDINPANPGHILLLPNEHYAIMPLIPEHVVARLFRVAKHLSYALLKALKAQGTTLFVANGLAAGQKAQHFMIHIIPRMPDDGLDFSLPQEQMTESDMSEVHRRIRTRLNEILGIEGEETEAKDERSDATTVAARKEGTDAPPKKHEISKIEGKPKDCKELDFNTISRFLGAVK
jgi:histidine triad (HIT) family protein